jgi:segregation and condensation protein B
MKDIEKKLEAILFVSGEALSLERLSKILKIDKDKIKEELVNLKNGLRGRGITLLAKDNAYALATAPEVGKIVEDFMREELGEDLSRAALETLAIVVYKGPLSRAQIDYIRGVNSSFSVRNLMVRGLIERNPDPHDSRSWLYSPSLEFMKYVGIDEILKLEGFLEFKKEMEDLLSGQNKDKDEEK